MIQVDRDDLSLRRVPGFCHRQQSLSFIKLAWHCSYHFWLLNNGPMKQFGPCGSLNVTELDRLPSAD